MGRWKPIRKIAAAFGAAAGIVVVVWLAGLAGIDVVEEGREALIAVLVLVPPVVGYLVADHSE